MQNPYFLPPFSSPSAASSLPSLPANFQAQLSTIAIAQSPGHAGAIWKQACDENRTVHIFSQCGSHIATAEKDGWDIPHDA